MRTVLKTLVMLWGIGAIAMADAAYDQTPLPSGPLVARAGDFSEWQVDFSYTEDKPAPPGAPASQGPNSQLPRRITVTKARPAWHVSVVYVNNYTEECWFDGAMPYLVSSSQPTPFSLNLDTPGLHLPPLLDHTGNRDFNDFAWVSPSNYVGTQKGTPYWVFEQSATGPKAWIDSSTRLPVRLESKSETRVYTFQPAPVGKLVFPPAITKLSVENQYINKISHNPPPHGA